MKTLIYVLTICATLSFLLVLWISDGFKDFGTSEAKPFMPFIWGIVGLGVVFEPLLLCDFLEKRTRTKNYLSLIVRGFIVGVTTFGVWAFLYHLGEKIERYQLGLLLAGWVLAVGIGVLGLIIAPNQHAQMVREPTSRLSEPTSNES